MASGLPDVPRSVPSTSPVFGPKAWIRPSPKLPISRSPENWPKFAGAIVMPHGELSTPWVAKRFTNTPEVVYRGRPVRGQSYRSPGVGYDAKWGPREPLQRGGVSVLRGAVFGGARG